CSLDHAEEIGLDFIIISSGNESVASSLDKTIQLVQSMRPLYKEKEVFKQIATNLSDNFLVYGPDGEISFTHITASDYYDDIINIVINHLDTFFIFPTR